MERCLVQDYVARVGVVGKTFLSKEETSYQQIPISSVGGVPFQSILGSSCFQRSLPQPFTTEDGPHSSTGTYKNCPGRNAFKSEIVTVLAGQNKRLGTPVMALIPSNIAF